MKGFKRYKQIKFSFYCRFKGYDMVPILATDFLFTSYGVQKSDIKSIFRNLLYEFELSSFLKELSRNQIIFTTKNYGKDYENLLNLIYKGASVGTIVKTEFPLTGRLRLGIIFVSFFQIMFAKFDGISFWEKLTYFSRLVFYKKIIHVLEKGGGSVNIKAYVSFLSATAPDSIFCEFFRKRGILSYCIQHGILKAIDDYPGNIPLDVVNLENFRADYLLGWGAYTQDVMATYGLSRERFILAGNPKYDASEIAIATNIRENGKVILCLARDAYYEDNLALLSLCGKLKKNKGYEVLVKLHPRSDISKYTAALNEYHFDILDRDLQIANSVQQIEPEFIIVYNSTVYYEYYLCNMVTLRYNQNENDIPLSLDFDGFQDYDELISVLMNISQMNPEIYSKKVSEVVDSVMGFSSNNYRRIFDEINA